MLRVFIDSGCSIKQEEKEKYNVELIPLKILLGEKEYLDGVDLTFEEFYDQLINHNVFPKTSLPDIVKLQEQVTKYTDLGDDVIIITISSLISGTFNAIRLAFEDNPKVHLVDSKCAVGGMRLIVDEINRHRNEPVHEILDKVNKLIPRICVLAIPETLAYLYKGGRLGKLSFVVGTILHIKPIIGFVEGKVHAVAKKRSLLAGMNYIIEELENCDLNYDIVGSYTYGLSNLEKLIELTPDKFKQNVRVIDNLDPAIACHWGPNAFGYIFVRKE